MGPSSSLSYDLSNHSLMSSTHAPIQITRKSKRKSKLRIAKGFHRMPKGYLYTAIFQKNHCFFNYIGHNSPRSFIRHYKNYIFDWIIAFNFP